MALVPAPLCGLGRQVDEATAEIDEPALRFLISRVGSDVRRLTNEIRKLAAAAMPGKRITPELIAALVPNSREISNFDLTDHLVAGRKSQALQVLAKILDDAARGVQAVAGPDPIRPGKRGRPTNSAVSGTGRKTSKTSKRGSEKIPRSFVTK